MLPDTPVARSDRCFSRPKCPHPQTDPAAPGAPEIPDAPNASLNSADPGFPDAPDAPNTPAAPTDPGAVDVHPLPMLLLFLLIQVLLTYKIPRLTQMFLTSQMLLMILTYLLYVPADPATHAGPAVDVNTVINKYHSILIFVRL